MILFSAYGNTLSSETAERKLSLQRWNRPTYVRVQSDGKRSRDPARNASLETSRSPSLTVRGENVRPLQSLGPQV